MNLTIDQLAKMCEGILSPNSDKNLIINEVVIDSREIKNGSLFVSIVGENHDGHSFVEGSMAKFKIAALVNKNNPNIENLNLPNLIYVEDTVLALGKLASAYRNLFNIPVVGITGSNGKTTVKEMLKSICDCQFGPEHVLATSGNFNNYYGMPLTLLRLKQEHKVAIIEMGMNHTGELDYLSKLAQPTVTVVNNVVLAHAGFFNSIEDIALAKAEIYHGLRSGGIACVNSLEPLHHIFEEHISNNVQKVYFGKTDYYIKESFADGGMSVVTPKGEISIKLQILGSHNQKNALTAITLAMQIGCSLENIVKGLNNYTGFQRRLERKLAFNGALIIDDSYNANLDSVKAAILAIQHLPKPHWFVLGDLKELGKFSEGVHKEVAHFAKEHNIDFLLTVGELTTITNTEFVGDKLHFANNMDIVKYCKENMPQTATILVKGSKSMKLYEVVNNLLK